MDGCYSFWQGGIFPLLQELLKNEEALQEQSWLFDHSALQEYLLVCCQDTRGGLVDKPGKSRDYYHTCYTLSGLSVAQHLPCDRTAVLGDPENILVMQLIILNKITKPKPISIQLTHLGTDY